MKVSVKRVYEPADRADGRRILVDRIWPRGVTKDKAAIEFWLKEVAPSTALRKWFGHKPENWPGFRKRYRDELKANPAFAELRDLCRGKTVTLVYGAKDETHNQAVALREFLAEKP